MSAIIEELRLIQKLADQENLKYVTFWRSGAENWDFCDILVCFTNTEYGLANLLMEKSLGWKQVFSSFIIIAQIL